MASKPATVSTAPADDARGAASAGSRKKTLLIGGAVLLLAGAGVGGWF